MRLLPRYLCREMFLPFVLGFGVFFWVIIFAQLLKLSDATTGVGMSLSDLLRIVFYSVPPLLGILLPVCCLLTTLMALGRLSADREWLALQSLGVAPWQLLPTPVVLSAMASLVSMLTMVYLEPWGIAQLKKQLTLSSQKALWDNVEPGRLVPWFDDSVIMVASKTAKQLYQLFLAHPEGQHPFVLDAKQGRLQVDSSQHALLLKMQKGRLWLEEADSHLQVHFHEGSYRMDIGQRLSHKSRYLASMQEKSLQQLHERMQDPHESLDQRVFAQIVWHRKWAMPLSCIIFTLLAIPLATRPAKTVKAGAFMWSLLLVTAYYYIGRAAELYARSGHMSGALAAWLPDLLGVCLMLYGQWRFLRGYNGFVV